MESHAIKREECTVVDSECLKKDSPELQLHTTVDFVNFLYMSELTAIENRSRTRQSNRKTYERNCLVDIQVMTDLESLQLIVFSKKYCPAFKFQVLILDTKEISFNNFT